MHITSHTRNATLDPKPIAHITHTHTRNAIHKAHMIQHAKLSHVDNKSAFVDLVGRYILLLNIQQKLSLRIEPIPQSPSLRVCAWF
jgi:hypothetical protein